MARYGGYVMMGRLMGLALGPQMPPLDVKSVSN